MLLVYELLILMIVCAHASRLQVRFILDKDKKVRLLKECHKGPTSGHLGARRMLSRVTERFMWPGVGKDVNNLVSYSKFTVKLIQSQQSPCVGGKL